MTQDFKELPGLLPNDVADRYSTRSVIRCNMAGPRKPAAKKAKAATVAPFAKEG
jgi:hypothetical protein